MSILERPPAPRSRIQPTRLVTPDRRSAVRLLDVDPDLVAGMPDEDYEGLRRSLIVPALDVPMGRWAPPASLGGAISVLVVSGTLICDLGTALEVPAVQLLGPGDLFDARLFTDAGTTWEMLTAVRLAVLDDRILYAVRRYPDLMLGLTRRLLDGQQDRHVLASIRGLAHTEDRIFNYLSYLASRWGRVTPAGLTLTLPVTQVQLGRLIAARRPTVSLALTALKERGALTRLDDGRWLLGAAAVG